MKTFVPLSACLAAWFVIGFPFMDAVDQDPVLWETHRVSDVVTKNGTETYASLNSDSPYFDFFAGNLSYFIERSEFVCAKNCEQNKNLVSNPVEIYRYRINLDWITARNFRFILDSEKRKLTSVTIYSVSL